MKTVTIQGLGEISRHVAAQIAVCDEAGADELVVPVPVVRALEKQGFTEKEVRQAIFTLERNNVLTKLNVGSYAWT
jgi:glutamate dehydrogenase/leucine dehydrogenase